MGSTNTMADASFKWDLQEIHRVKEAAAAAEKKKEDARDAEESWLVAFVVKAREYENTNHKLYQPTEGEKKHLSHARLSGFSDEQIQAIAKASGVSMQAVTQAYAKESSNPAAAKNLESFLHLIAHSEGTFGVGENGYNQKVGFGDIANYKGHPHQVIDLGHGLRSSAAGRYQFLGKTWDSLAAKLGLKDFSPQAQDAAALALVKEAGALDDVCQGRIEQALHKCKKIWASFPGAGYGQHEHKMDTLLAFYQKTGGSFEGAMHPEPKPKDTHLAHASAVNSPVYASMKTSLVAAGKQKPKEAKETQVASLQMHNVS